MGINPDALYEAVYRDVQAIVPSSDRPTGSSVKGYAAEYLLKSVIRKWIPSDTKDADAASKQTFISANNRCKDWKFSPADDWDRELVGEIQRVLNDFFHPYAGRQLLVQSFYDILAVGRPGPGVNVGSLGTSYYTKYQASPLTTTSLYLYEMYRDYCAWLPTFSEAESIRYEKFGCPSVVSGSRCSFVPKTNKASRMICIEPSLNMYYQLGLATILQARLRSYFGIDLQIQPKVNSELARLGSIDGRYATIDLSSASDSISLRLCEMLLPKWFFELLLQLRSRTTEIDGKRVPLFMISTMGNGFTFPLQTIIFSAILSACERLFLKKGATETGTWSCFGDDLIRRREIYPDVIRALTLLGFSPNPDKTFSEGPFRESCGSDWFCGQPVRPVFIRKLASPFDIMVAINQFNEWSAYTGIPLRETVHFLYSHLGAKFINFVPFDSSYDAGIRVPLAYFTPRRNRNLSFVFKTWEKRPYMLRIGEGKIRFPGKVKECYYNPAGLYASFLFGELVGFSISVRHDRSLRNRRLRCSPYWDYIPTSSLTNGVRLEWRRWESAVMGNLPITPH